MPAYRSCTKYYGYAGATEWSNIGLLITTGATGFTSESNGVTAKVYGKLLEEKLIPAYRKLIEIRPAPLRDHPWV
jgi:hypothetical protein